ncbi:MAG: VOC family protein [Saprospiraceae bacterium]
MATHFLGLRTLIFPAPDLAAAKDWYTQALGLPPYFDQPFYVGFNVGGFVLGLDPNGAVGENGQQVYWGVENISAAISHLESLGASLKNPVQDVGDGILVATLRDPFGNELGVIQNPHFALTNS